MISRLCVIAEATSLANVFMCVEVRANSIVYWCWILQRIQFAREKSDVIAKRDGTFKPREKRSREDDDGAVGAKRAPKAGGRRKPAGGPTNPPHSKLLVQNLPDDVTEDELRKLFSQYAGLTDLRVISARNLAFVEYTNEAEATVALQGLNNFNLRDDEPLFVAYAKK